jgi:recombination protein RecA
MARVRVKQLQNDSKKSELSETFDMVRKRYGAQSVRFAKEVTQPERISTGSFMLDFCLLGGIPHNRCTMIVGEKHAGKTMLASKIIANAQEKYEDQTPVFIDVEGTFDSTWAQALGVNIDTLPVVPCETGEMAVDIADAVVGSRDTSLVIIDSLAALTPMKEVESSAEDALVGVQARLVSGMVRRLTVSLIKERNRGHFVTVLFLNQFRAKIGGFNPGFGEARSIPGGKALEYATTVQLTIKNKESKGKDAVGIETMAFNEHPFSIQKNKLNSGPRAGEFRLVRVDEDETGLTPGDIDNAPTILAYAKKFGLYTGGGSSWKLEFDDYDFSFGKAKEAIQALYEDPQLEWDLRCHLLRLQAANLGMPEDFIDTIW